jgi:hypothetical protein
VGEVILRSVGVLLILDQIMFIRMFERGVSGIPFVEPISIWTNHTGMLQ